eukprot:3571194-Prymnesium_polylepis.1
MDASAHLRPPTQPTAARVPSPRDVELARVVRVDERGLHNLLRVGFRERLRRRRIRLAHARAHLGEQAEEERQEGAHATVVEVEVPFDVLLEPGALQGWADTREVVGAKDGLVEALLGECRDRQVEALQAAAPLRRGDDAADIAAGRSRIPR